MASFVPMGEAQQHLNEILDRVERGEEIFIRREGRPATRLSLAEQVTELPERRRGGQNLLGITYIAPDFDNPMSDAELAAWGY